MKEERDGEGETWKEREMAAVAEEIAWWGGKREREMEIENGSISVQEPRADG